MDRNRGGLISRHARRFLALLLAGGIAAASSGLAIHDPDCPHHGLPLPAAPSHAAASAGHHDSSEPSGHANHGNPTADCQCVGFCALAGAADPAHPGSGPAVAPGVAQARTGLGPTEGVWLSLSPRLVQPPATGPPVVA